MMLNFKTKLLLSLLMSSSISLADSFVVEFKSPPTALELKSVKTTLGLSSIRRLDEFPSSYFKKAYLIQSPLTAVELLKRLSPARNIAKISQSQNIQLMSLVPSTDTTAISNDPFANYQWALRATDQVIWRKNDDIHSVKILGDPKRPMDIGLGHLESKLDESTSTNVVVAVLDSGVDYNHEDISASLYRNDIECDGGKIPFKPTQDKDGNGYNGDCLGWNFAVPDANGNNDPADDLGHGTHVSGIIAAQIGNGLGISGVSKHIKILPVKVTGANNSALTHRIANAILYAVKRKVNVINFSLGWPSSADSDFLRQAFAEAKNAGITIVAAAGNNTSAAPIYPCAYSGVICVGAVTIDGTVANFSNYGGHVDLMAPGEEILSLYPKSMQPSLFSVKGYEIKNGTSQATPYVSASVALLKALKPGISDDEILARLYLSAKPVDFQDKFAMAGSLNLEKANGVSPQAVVRPDFKNVYQVFFNAQTGAFSLSLPIKNLWLPASNIKVSVIFDSQNLSLAQSEFLIPRLAQGESQVLRLNGSIQNTRDNREHDLQVILSVDGGPSLSFKQRVVFTRDLQNDPEVLTLPIQLLSPQPNLKLFSVATLHDIYSSPDYYYTETSKDGVNFHLVHLIGGKFVDEKPLFFPGAQALSFILKADFNYDGSPDYMIASFQKQDKDSYLQFSYFNSSLQPLFGNGASSFRVLVEGGIIDQKAFTNLALMPIPYAGGYFASLVFSTTGVAPKADLNPDPFQFESNIERPRLYYYVPDHQNQKPVLSTRNFDNYLWESKIKSQLNLPFRQDIAIAKILPQSLTQAKAGEIFALVSVGSSSLKSYQLIKLSHENILSHTFQVLSSNYEKQTFEGSDTVSSVDLDNQANHLEGPTGFVSFYSGSLGRVSLLQTGIPSSLSLTQNISPVREQDHLLGFIQSYRSHGEQYSFFQSQSNLLLVKRSGTSDQISSTGIDRSSLIPGTVFNALYFPIVGEVQGNKAPAIYVDLTQIFARQVFIWTLNDGKMTAPMNMNVKIPDSCRSLAPRKFGEQDSYSYVLLCQNPAGDWIFKTLPVQ